MNVFFFAIFKLIEHLKLLNLKSILSCKINYKFGLRIASHYQSDDD